MKKIVDYIKSLFPTFKKDERGNVVMYIVVLAVVMLGLAAFSPQGKFYIKYWFEEKASSNQDKAMETMDGTAGTSAPGSSIGSGGGLVSLPPQGEQVSGILNPPTITVGPNNGPYTFSYNDNLTMKASANGAKHYVPKEPFVCKWEGFGTYSGSSCEPPSAEKFPLGRTTVKVTMCDQRKACASATKIIDVDYQDPLLTMHTTWTNYIQNGGASGQWQYDAASKTIYTTQNVNWTGYWNPADKTLQDYILRFKMTVDPLNDDDVIGMTFRMKDTNNLYLLTVDRYWEVGNGVGGYHSGLYKLVNGTKTQLADFKPLYWKAGKYMDVEISAIGNHIKVTIDGKVYADITDNSHLNGAYGPMTWSQAYGKFKDLSIEAIK